MPSLFQKSAIATLDYNVDWRLWLTGDEEIVSSSWILPDDLTLEGSEISSPITKAYISGGTNGQIYTVKNQITTDSTPARVDQRSFQLFVVER